MDKSMAFFIANKTADAYLLEMNIILIQRQKWEDEYAL